MRHLRYALLILSMVIVGVASAHAATSITIGKGDFYVSIGDYDYLPYGYGGDRLPRVSFYDMMNQYGTWVTVSPFGRAWRPYVYYDWRPYTYGHWTYTRYGPTWLGYEPWAWAAYHYGNWIWSQYYGWVWLPGYDWHPGRVTWSYSYNVIGWMPAPPQGYNYFCGYLCPERYTYGGGYGGGYNNQTYPRSSDRSSDRSSGDYYNFEDYNDYDDYSDYEDYGDYNSNNDNAYDNYGSNDRYGNSRYPTDSYDQYYSYGFRYDPYFYSAAYLRIAPRLWVFVPVNYYNADNYADVYFDVDFVRYLFDRRLLQINRRGLDRNALEQIVRQRISEQQVQVKQMETDGRPVRVVIPMNDEQEIRTHANRVVKEVIAPAFVEKRKAFKGEKARNKEVVTRVFKQPDKNPAQVEIVNDQTLLNEAKKAQEERKVKRQQIVKRGIETIEKADREGKLEPIKRARDKAEKKEKANKTTGSQNRSEDKIQKRTVPPSGTSPEPQANSGKKFENWKQRETAKFNAWKERQLKEFENWKELNKDKPQDEIKRAEADFQQRMRKAEDEFQKRTQQAQSGKRTGR